MTKTQPTAWQAELNSFIRAFSGAFLFGTPLLFTLALIGLSLVITCMIVFASGFDPQGSQERKGNIKVVIHSYIDPD